MDYWLLPILAAFFLSMLFSGIFIPKILLVAFKKKLFDLPDERKIHQGIVPRLGGIAFTPVICFTLSLLIGCSLLMGESQLQSIMDRETLPLSMGFCALFLIYVVGIGDDLIGIRYRAKFIVQIMCAILMIAGGVWISSFHGFLNISAIPAWIGFPMSVLAVVFICNALNLIDGIDGLASGLAMTGFIVYGIAFYLLNEPVYVLISAASCGVLLPFFYYNVFGDPSRCRKIFMGDAGSLTIGLLLSFLCIKLFTVPDFTITGLNCNTLIIAISPLIVPCCDVVRVFLGRIRRGRSPFLPDRSHIHHKLLALGIPSRIAMIAIVIVAIFFAVFNIIISHLLDTTVLIVLDILFWCIANYGLSRAIAHKGIHFPADLHPTK